MLRRIISVLIAVVVIYGIFILGAVNGNGSPDSLPSTGHWLLIIFLSILFGEAIFVAITGKLRSTSVLGAVGTVTLIFTSAALGFTEFSLKLLDEEMIFFVIGLGTIPAATGGAFGCGSDRLRKISGGLFLAVSVGSSIYVGGNFLFRLIAHTIAMVPGFLLAYIHSTFTLHR
ncbi:hypothetical protein [Halobacterium noricense]|uniref:hypothetical protein n=1 Tax=Halobacterium noricense TaxID=223182 RepID=UPI001E5D2951|nr:hypothetical protein [Halobacterium noricense]UHH24956.1 hypothetical protein LT974_13340 [Halobacterium noricense]